MSQCSIYFPGLLGPDVPIKVLDKNEWPGVQQIPNLSKLLSRGHYRALSKADIETRILNGMGISFSGNEDVPVARLRVQQLPLIDTQKSAWCLDPVFIQIDKEDAVVQAHENIELSESEARHIIDDLNTHFAEDGFKLHYHSVYRWVLEAELDLITTSLSSAMYKNISQLQPAGTSEKRWWALLNEIQMLLYNHPVNEARESRGAIPVNSLWLWGGSSTVQYEPLIDSIFCNEQWVTDVAQLYDIDFQSTDDVKELKALSESCLMLYTDLLGAIRQSDAFAWLDSLKEFEQTILSTIMNMMEKDKLQTLMLYSDTVSISIRRADLKKWWKRIRPVRDTIIKARSAYGI